jgi:hypothetical protein
VTGRRVDLMRKLPLILLPIKTGPQLRFLQRGSQRPNANTDAGPDGIL